MFSFKLLLHRSSSSIYCLLGDKRVLLRNDLLFALAIFGLNLAFVVDSFTMLVMLNVHFAYELGPKG